jgi:hypothetical protein
MATSERKDLPSGHYAGGDEAVVLVDSYGATHCAEC